MTYKDVAKQWLDEHEWLRNTDAMQKVFNFAAYLDAFYEAPVEKGTIGEHHTPSKAECEHEWVYMKERGVEVLDGCRLCKKTRWTVSEDLKPTPSKAECRHVYFEGQFCCMSCGKSRITTTPSKAL